MNYYSDITAILTTFDKAMARVEPPAPDKFKRECWQRRVAAGEPALNDTDFPVKQAASLLRDVINGNGKRELDQLDAVYLVLGYLSDQPFADCRPDPRKADDLEEIYVHLACQTALIGLAEAVRTVVSVAGWGKNYCLVCGTYPSFSYLDKEDGHRQLVCGSCLTSWRFKRIGCTFCGEEQPNRLKVLTTDAFSGWTIRACLTCHAYIKTADLRQMAAVPRWQSAPLDTLALDHAATKWLSEAAPRANSSLQLAKAARTSL